ncbi:hypothetical protein NHQ30_008242 [Ciborinia camelliae]|nr:hypothetical protein NHQ30_008242 [Ciborinia camelliae]
MESPAGGDVDRGPTIMAIMWAQAAVSCLVVALRFWARITIKALGKDDWVMLCTLINFLVFCGFVTVQALHGGDRHLFYIPLDQQEFVIKMTWLLQPFVILAICLGKVSIALLMMRLLSPSPKWPKHFLWFCIISCLIFVFIDIIFTYVQCTPAKALWDPTVPHTCWEPKFSDGISRGTVHPYDGVTYDMKLLASPLSGREVDLEDQQNASTIRDQPDSISIRDKNRHHSMEVGN